MDLQQVFYLVAIIFMTLLIIIMVGMCILLYYIKKKISDIHHTVNEKIALFTRFTSEPRDIAMQVGSAVASSAIRGVKNLMKKR